MSATTIIVNDETPRRQYTASAGQTVFDFPFPFFENGDLEVYKTPAGQTADDTNDILAITTDYTVSGADTQNGGKITLTSGAANGDIITILRVVDIDRTADYQAAGDLLAETLNREQDTEIMISQQLREEAERSIRLQKSDVKVDMTLPAQADRKDTVLTFDTDGKPQATNTADFVSGLSGAIIGANYITNNATGDGSTVAFSLSTAPGAKGNLQIYIDGVYQNKASFSLSGTTVTFTEAPPLNASVEFIIGYSIGSATGAASIDFTQAGTGAVTRTVESKLNEFVSVKDFGAVGDGVTDDTAAIQAAIDSGNDVFLPRGSYKVTSSLSITSGTRRFFGEGASSRIESVGAIDVLVIGDGTNQCNSVIVEKLVIRTTDGLATKGLWTKKANSAIFRDLQVLGKDGTSYGFTTAALQFDFSYDVAVENVITYNFSTVGFRCGQDASFASNQINQYVFTNCQAYSATGWGYVVTGSGNTFVGCLAEQCALGGMDCNYTPGLNISGGYWENNGGSGSGEAFKIRNSTTGVSINGAYINHSSITTGNKCITVNTSDSIVISGCTFRLNKSGDYGVYAESGGNAIYGIGNILTPAVSGASLYGGADYPNEYIQLNDEYIPSDLIVKGTPAATTFLNTDTTINSGDVFGNLQWESSDISAGNAGVFAKINAVANRVFDGDNASGMSLAFYTGRKGTGLVEQGRWDQTTGGYADFRPSNDNSQNLGSASYRWAEVFAGTGTINTSDLRDKQDIADLEDAEKTVALALKGKIKKFRFKDAVEAKGDNARIHVGVIAQEVEMAFTENGLDPNQYGIFCYDEWYEIDGVTVHPNSNGDYPDGATKHGRYGVRYDELFAFIIGAM